MYKFLKILKFYYLNRVFKNLSDNYQDLSHFKDWINDIYSLKAELFRKIRSTNSESTLRLTRERDFHLRLFPPFPSFSPPSFPDRMVRRTYYEDHYNARTVEIFSGVSIGIRGPLSIVGISFFYCLLGKEGGLQSRVRESTV